MDMPDSSRLDDVGPGAVRRATVDIVDPRKAPSMKVIVWRSVGSREQTGHR